MMRARLSLAVLCALVSTGAMAATSHSWGKPGATREAFEGGSRDCMLKAARRDVSGDKPTEKYLRGFEALERENNMPPMPAIPGDDQNFVRSERQVLLRRMYRPDQHVDTLQGQLQAEVDRCLIAAGYIRFTLTRAQERTLRHLRPGSEARKAYLYTLGSDSRIVEAQKVIEP